MSVYRRTEVGHIPGREGWKPPSVWIGCRIFGIFRKSKPDMQVRDCWIKSTRSVGAWRRSNRNFPRRLCGEAEGLGEHTRSSTQRASVSLQARARGADLPCLDGVYWLIGGLLQAARPALDRPWARPDDRTTHNGDSACAL